MSSGNAPNLYTESVHMNSVSYTRYYDWSHTVFSSHTRKLPRHFFDYATAASFQILYNPPIINHSTTDDIESEVLTAS